MPEVPIPQLPHANVLGYITPLTSSTRVRRVAAISILALAALYIITCALLVVGDVASGIHERAVDIAFTKMGPVIPAIVALYNPKPTLTDYAEATLQFVQQFALESFLIGALAAFGLLQLIFFRAINRGHRAATFICRPTLIPAMIFFALATAMLFGSPVAIFNTETSLLWALLLVPLGIIPLLLVMLLIDLWRFLTWIGRHPGVEKPPVPFLP